MLESYGINANTRKVLVLHLVKIQWLNSRQEFYVYIHFGKMVFRRFWCDHRVIELGRDLLRLTSATTMLFFLHRIVVGISFFITT